MSQRIDSSYSDDHPYLQSDRIVGLIDISEENFYDWHPNACNLGDGRKGTVESELLMLWIDYLNFLQTPE